MISTSCRERARVGRTADVPASAGVQATGFSRWLLTDAYQLSRLVSAEVDRFKRVKRKRYSDEAERKTAYVTEIGTFVDPVFSELDLAVPQISIFGMALLFEKNKALDRGELTEFVAKAVVDPIPIWKCFVELIAARASIGADKSWPTLLKSGAFYRDAVAHLKVTWDCNAAP